MAKIYRVVLFGVNVDEDAFQKNMARLGVSSSALKDYLAKIPVVLVRNLNLPDARRYADAIINAGGLATIQETGETPQTISSYKKPNAALQEEDFMICTNCGLKQKRAPRCVRCGFEVISSS
jgi:hypothetical protein